MEPKPIAFLFPAFPVLHQTFVLWEVLALRRQGVRIELYSIKRPSTRSQQPEGTPLAQEVHYLPWMLSLPVLAANLQTLWRAPRRYLGAYARLVWEWWRDRSAGRAWQQKRMSNDAPDRLLTFVEVLRGRFNRSATLYLLKSLWLVPQAVYVGVDLRARGIERVHAHWASYPATMALVMHWVFDMPFSFTAHAYDIYMVPRLLRSKVEEAEFVVTCARVNAKFLESLAGGVHRIVVNYHGVSLDRFRPVTPRAGAATRCVVTCGRLEPYKGHHVLLRACARLTPPPRCVIVGEGPQRRRLEELAAELGIRDRVEFTGPLPQAELAQRYAEADVFVLASVVLERSGKRDVIPNVLAEAMAMQLPVVATDISGVGELITDGVSGRLVPPNDPQTLAMVLDELFRDESQRRRLALAGYDAVVASFNRDTNIRDLAALFLGESVASA
jgi:colanic acid/amylovoran biosynthesis glycosyltransferase